MESDELGTSAFQRIFDVIRLVGERPGITLTEVAAGLGVHKSTAHRICGSLVRAGFLEQLANDAPSAGRLCYRLGLWLFVLGSRAAAALEIKRHAPPILRRLARAVQLPVYLTVVWNGLTICLEEESGPTGSVWLGSSVGVPHPNHATATGKLFLASLSDAEARAYLTAHPPERGLLRGWRGGHADPEALLAKLPQVRQAGYAFNDEETEYGVRYLGVPVHDPRGRFLACITAGATVEQHEPEGLVALLPQLRAAAEALEARVARDGPGTLPDGFGPAALHVPPDRPGSRPRVSRESAGAAPEATGRQK
jgi:DNA-binding IclR family transcriptional regulator